LLHRTIARRWRRVCNTHSGTWKELLSGRLARTFGGGVAAGLSRETWNTEWIEDEGGSSSL
jgi:hypothetical protein